MQTVQPPEPVTEPLDPAQMLANALDAYWSDDLATEPLRSNLRMAAVFRYLAAELGVPQ